MKKVVKTTATKAEDKFIRKYYLTIPEKTMAKKLNRSYVFVRTRKRQLGLVVPKHIIEQRMVDSRIKPGNIPPNKGKKMNKNVYRKCKPTMFRKGNIPINTLHDGAITIRHDHPNRKGYKYKWIRIDKAKWEMLHVHNWVKIYGPIPNGYIVVFKNGDTMNCDVNNLEMITLAENMRRNTIHRYPVELKKTIMLLWKLKRKIISYGKKQNH